MQIRPTKSDLETWTQQVPSGGDLLFFDRASRPLACAVKAPVLTTDEVRAQSLELWKLSDRSWYGYALNKATFAAYIPRGSLEKLDGDLLKRLGRAQAQLGVPSLIQEKLIPKQIRNRFIKVGNSLWVTSSAFKSLSKTSRTNLMDAWMIQNAIHFYPSISYEDLPGGPRALLKSLGLDGVLNQYAHCSGPNCMAATAAAIAADSSLANYWLHWPPLERFLRNLNYRMTRSHAPLPGDVLVFKKGETTAHSAFYLGEGLYFEKPGQDFYEPYRIAHFKEWKIDWPETRLTILRRKK